MRRSWGGAALLAAGIPAAALLLRAPIAAVPPALLDIRTDLGLSAAATGATTSLPLICLGVFAFVTPFLVARHGLERTMPAVLIPILVGILLRSAGTGAAFFAGAVLIGCGIAMGNVLLPALIRARFAGAVALTMGVYTATLHLSAAIGSAGTAPLQAHLGWAGALAVWAAPAGAVLALWVAIIRRAPAYDPRAARPPTGLVRVASRPLSWAITAFMGLQSLTFYTLMTWLPAQLTDTGLSASAAGLVLGLFSLLGLPGALVAPRAATSRHAGLAVAGTFAVQAAGVLLLFAGPLWAVTGACLCGLAQGCGFAIALTFVAHQVDPHDVPALSALSQGFGYLLAAVGPIAVGATRAASGTWLVPNGILLATIAALAAIGIPTGRRLHALHHAVGDPAAR